MTGSDRMKTRPIAREDLDRFVDGTLDPERREAVAAHLAADADAAEEVAALRRIDALLRARFDGVADEPVPPALLRAATREGARRETLGRLARVAAVALLAAGLGAFGGWYGRGLYGGISGNGTPAWAQFAREAAAAHRLYAPDRDFPVEVSAERSRRLFDWLTRRIGAPVRAPARLGDYRLIGGSLLPADDGPAALFMYENSRGGRLTLYLRADLLNRGEVAFQVRREGDVNVLYWLDGPRGYALSGDVDRRVLLGVAEGLYEAVGS